MLTRENAPVFFAKKDSLRNMMSLRKDGINISHEILEFNTIFSEEFGLMTLKRVDQCIKNVS